jgi:hypothetical protein
VAALNLKSRSVEAVGHDASLEEVVELILDESRQLGAAAGLGVRDEA